MIANVNSKGLSIAGALLLSACTTVEIEPTGAAIFHKRLPETFTHVGTDFGPPKHGDPVVLVPFRTSHSIEAANTQIEVFGPFLHLLTCDSHQTLAVGSLFSAIEPSPSNTYVAAFRHPIRDEVLRWAAIDRNTGLLARATPDSTCFRLYGGNMFGMTLSSQIVRTVLPGLADTLTFTDAEIAAVCPECTASEKDHP